jgi:hypothetical protein
MSNHFHLVVAALVTTIQPGQYTAQVRGKNDSIYALN